MKKLVVGIAALLLVIAGCTSAKDGNVIKVTWVDAAGVTHLFDATAYTRADDTTFFITTTDGQMITLSGGSFQFIEVTKD